MSKCGSEMLLDDFIKSGTDFNEFKTTLKELDDVTTVYPVNTQNIKLLSYSEELSTDDNLVFYELESGYKPFVSPAPRKRHLKKEAFNKSKVSKELIKEIVEKNRIILETDFGTSICGRNILATLSQRCDMGGDAFFTPSLARDMDIAYNLRAGKCVNIMTRKADGITKAFAMPTAKYAYVPLSSVCNVIDALKPLGTPVCYKWDIDQQKVDVYLEFPDKAKELADTYDIPDEIVPGITITTSDTANSSLFVRGYVRSGSCVMQFGELAAKHIGDLDIEKIVSGTKKKIFPQYATIPARLCQLLTVDITKKGRTEKNKAQNAQRLNACISSVTRESGIQKLLGKKVCAQLESGLMSEFDPSKAYTAYNVAMSFMTLAERISGLPRGLEHDFEEKLGNVPFCDFLEKKEEKIALV